MTTMLFMVNLLLFLALPSQYGVELPPSLSQKVTDKSFITVQSYLYENYLQKAQSKEWRRWVDSFYRGGGEPDLNQIDEFWYKLSFRDGEFLRQIFQLKPYPDPVMYESWKKNYSQLQDYQRNDLSGIFGISLLGYRWSHFFTYQFIHAGWLHLLSNMMILIFFGVLVELQMGSLVMLMVYLLGGAIGGLFYSQLSGLNLAPLVGASGSVSALISFFMVMEPRRHLRFFFFLVPVEDYFGDIYLSKWWLVPLLILGDLNAVLSTPDWTQGVAHSAHLGAILFGFSMGFIFSIFKKSIPLHETLSWVEVPGSQNLP